MYKKVNMVMLPTNEKAIIHSYMYKLGLRDKPLNTYQMNGNSQISYAQHLYILSDEKIKKGDWVINNLDKGIGKALRSLNKGEIKDKEYSKIIATTDKSLNANRAEDSKLNVEYIHQSFIEYFVSEYNKGNIITEVMVEYIDKEELRRWYHENGMYNAGSDLEMNKELKINPDNTINIKPIKINKYEDLYKAIDKIKEGHKGSAINFIERFINTQKN